MMECAGFAGEVKREFRSQDRACQEVDRFSPSSSISHSLRHWNSVLANVPTETNVVDEPNLIDNNAETSERERVTSQQIQGNKSLSFQVGTEWRTRKATRRHSIAIGTYNQRPPEFEKPRSRRSSVSSDISVASFAGREYSSMMAAWVDEGLGDLEDNLMVLSANDFKIVALSPLKSSHQPSRSESCSSASTDPTDTKQASEELLKECHLRANQVCDALAERQESGVDTHSSHALQSTSSVSRSRSAERNTKTRRGQRRSSLLAALSQWPTFAAGPEELSRVRRTLDSLSFSALDYSPDDLCVLVSEIFFEMELDVRLRISRSAVQGFVLAARARMLDNAYHNWTHVVDVTQTVYALARISGVYDTLTDKQRLVLFLAALCHDLEHPGVTAGYLLKSKSTLAARYKEDLGLLEKHHSIRAFQLLACQEINLLQSLSNPDKLEVTSLVRDVIMATDMRQHADFFDAVKTRISSPATAATPAAPAPTHPHVSAASSPSTAASSPSTAGPSPSTAVSSPPTAVTWPSSPGAGAGRGCGGWETDAAVFQMQLLLKCADISNVLKPFAVAREWAVRVTDEFFSQGDLERSNGLEVTGMCDRERQSRVGLQKGFIDHVAGPFHRGVAELLPRLRHLLPQMELNRQLWEEVTDEALVNAMQRRRSH